jgi:hypothetical protein
MLAPNAAAIAVDPGTMTNAAELAKTDLRAGDDTREHIATAAARHTAEGTVPDLIAGLLNCLAAMVDGVAGHARATVLLEALRLDAIDAAANRPRRWASRSRRVGLRHPVQSQGGHSAASRR